MPSISADIWKRSNINRHGTMPLTDTDGRILSLLGAVSDQDINRLSDSLLRLDAQSAKEITIFVSCQGGGIVDGLKLVDVVGLLQSPVTAVGLGVVEGAGLLLLAVSNKRVLFPSTIISTAGLWTLPRFQSDALRGIGIYQGADPKDRLLAQLRQQIEKISLNSKGKIPPFLTDPSREPLILNAAQSIDMGLVDSIIEGPTRSLTQPVKQTLKNYARAR